PAPSGGSGWVTATPLYNYAMPPIRYEHVVHGGFAAEADEQSPIALPTLRSIIGKTPTIFEFPGGVRVRATLRASHVIKHLGARACQVAQVADDRCEFRIVPGTMKAEDMQFDQITELLRKTWWAGLRV